MSATVPTRLMSRQKSERANLQTVIEFHNFHEKENDHGVDLRHSLKSDSVFEKIRQGVKSQLI